MSTPLQSPFRAGWEKKQAPLDENRAGWRKFYKTPLWKKLRKKALMRQPLCAFRCGRVSAVVDHIEPHKGDAGKFYRQSNLQALCKPCHDSIKKRIEQGADMTPYDASGWPVETAATGSGKLSAGRGEGKREGERVKGPWAPCKKFKHEK